MRPHPDSAAALAAHPLFEPIAPWLERFTSPRLPEASALTALLREVAPHARTASGLPLRFEHTDVAHAYEAHIDASGVVPTRRDDWHDFFNALSWCAWPAAKAALNAAHADEIAARSAAALSGRGRRRDALTQFDECGMVVVSCDPCVPALLAAHAWEAVFVVRRATLPHTTRFFVVGHASWEALRRPFVGLCAKTMHRVVSKDWLAQGETAQRQELDRWLADMIADRQTLATPRSLCPLPLCGIPGVTHENESPAYYRDTRQFRPRRTT